MRPEREANNDADYVEIDVALIRRETEKAFLVVLQERGAAFLWIPKSQIADAGDFAEGDRDLTLSITRWIAEQKELIST